MSGTVVGDDYVDYVVNARQGQTLAVDLSITGTNGNGSAMFSIVPAGQDYPAVYNGNFDDDNRASVELPESGDWAIRVYLMGNDRDTGRTVGFSLDISIASGSAGSGSGSSAGAGLLPEEDLFVVRLSNSGGSLNMRDAPRPSGRLVGTLANGETVSNVGGCTISDGQQWCQVQAARGGSRGWVAARFLALPGPGSASGPTGRIVTIAGVPQGDVLNVRSGPGAGNAIVGALSNDTQVRELRCDSQGGSRWCEIEMMTDMRGRGWINARYIAGNGPSATQLPSANRMERVRFEAGASGAEFSDQLGAGTSVTYLIGAGNGQMLYTRVAAQGSGLAWRLYNPDGTLLDEGAPSKEYRGQLFQSGDHRLEVANRSGSPQSFTVIVGID